MIRVVLQAQCKENCGSGKAWFGFLPTSFTTALCPLTTQGLSCSVYFQIPLSSEFNQTPPRYAVERELASGWHLPCARHVAGLSHFLAPENMCSYLHQERLHLPSYEEFEDSKLFKSIYSFSHLFIYSCVLFFNKCACAKLLHSCLALCDPMDCNPPGFSISGILQTRILEWVAMPSSRGCFQLRDHVSCLLPW